MLEINGVFIVNFDLISHLVLVFPLLTLSRYMPAGKFAMILRTVSLKIEICLLTPFLEKAFPVELGYGPLN